MKQGPLILAMLMATPALAQQPNADPCTRACAQMRLVSENEAKTVLTPKQRRAAEGMTAEAERMAKCVTACRSGRFEPACVLRATTTMQYVQCLSRPKSTPALSEPPTHANGMRGRSRAMRPDTRQRLLRALAKVEPKLRLRLLGSALAEAGGEMYGSDLKRAFDALARDAGAYRSHEVMHALMLPTVQLGCARPAAEMVQRHADEQARFLAAQCPPPPRRRLIPVSAAKGASPDLLLLALVLEHRARSAKLARDPVHKKAIEILLTARR